jgi:hypothetical protein
MEQHPLAPKLNTAREQAAQIRISLRHLQNLCNKRLIPFIKLGKSIRFDPVAVQKALQKLEVKAR